MKYISKEQNLLKYKYAGSDRSLLYKYLLSPLADKLVEYIPEYVAPNLLTLIGTLHAVAAHVLLNFSTLEPWKYVCGRMDVLCLQHA